MREISDKNAVVIVKFVPQLSCVSQDSEALVSQKPDAKRLGTDSKNTIHSVLRYVKQLSGKRKDHRLETYKSKILISEVPAL